MTRNFGAAAAASFELSISEAACPCRDANSGGPGGRPVFLASPRLHRVPTHFLLTLHGIQWRLPVPLAPLAEWTVNPGAPPTRRTAASRSRRRAARSPWPPARYSRGQPLALPPLRPPPCSAATWEVLHFGYMARLKLMTARSPWQRAAAQTARDQPLHLPLGQPDTVLTPPRPSPPRAPQARWRTSPTGSATTPASPAVGASRGQLEPFRCSDI